MAKRRDYEELADIELPLDEDKEIAAKIEQAEQDLDEARISFRWGKEQLEVVKQAANIMGVPYQTFIKLAVFEHALSVLKDSQAIRNTNDAA